MKTWTLPLIGLALFSAGSALAQGNEGRYAFRLGYYLGNDYRESGDKRTVEGWEIGGDIPIVRRLGKSGSLCFSPSIVIGRTNLNPSSSKYNLFRLMATYKIDLGNSGAYAGLGVGIALTDTDSGLTTGGFPANSQNSFRSPSPTVVSGSAQVIFGYNFRTGAERPFTPFVEGSYYFAGNIKQQGLSLNAGVRF